MIPAAIIRSKGWRKGGEFLVSDMPDGIKFTRGEIQTPRKLAPAITKDEFYADVFGDEK